MSLELWNTFATFGTFVVIAATAIAGLIQLRHLSAGNQINALLSIGEEFKGQAYGNAWYLVNAKLEQALEDRAFRDYVIALQRGLTPPDVDPQYVELHRATLLVGNTHEDLGVLVKNGIVDKDLFFDRYTSLIDRAWKRLEIFTALLRGAAGSQTPWENFEYLAVPSEQWVQGHPNTYPKDLKRLKLRNPWPVPPRPATA